MESGRKRSVTRMSSGPQALSKTFQSILPGDNTVHTVPRAMVGPRHPCWRVAYARGDTLILRVGLWLTAAGKVGTGDVNGHLKVGDGQG